jgi:hypothetical protein
VLSLHRFNPLDSRPFGGGIWCLRTTRIRRRKRDLARRGIACIHLPDRGASEGVVAN